MKILSIDGGGIRGVVPLTYLTRFNITSKADWFVGTSTGGVIALTLAYGHHERDLLDFYQLLGTTVFKDSLIDNIKDAGNWLGAQYSIEPLKEILVENFGDTRLGDLPKKAIIPTFDLVGNKRWKPKIFHNLEGIRNDSEELLVDVAIRTASAPTFFPAYQGYIDGGVYANNPSMIGLAQSLEKNFPLSETSLLSLGTGYYPDYLDVDNADWGKLQWVPYLIDMLMDGMQGIAHYQCRHILKERYFRQTVKLGKKIAPDEPHHITLLQQVANEQDLTRLEEWLELYW